eukprot:scaffold2830_cov131-Cylindrotheca_fusiformis.AAC.67
MSLGKIMRRKKSCRFFNNLSVRHSVRYPHHCVDLDDLDDLCNPNGINISTCLVAQAIAQQ